MCNTIPQTGTANVLPAQIQANASQNQTMLSKTERNLRQLIRASYQSSFAQEALDKSLADAHSSTMPDRIYGAPDPQIVENQQFVSRLKEEERTRNRSDGERMDIKARLVNVYINFKNMPGKSEQFEEILDNLKDYLLIDANALSKQEMVAKEQDSLKSFFDAINRYFDDKNEKYSSLTPAELKEYGLVSRLKEYFHMESSGYLSEGEINSSSHKISVDESKFSLKKDQEYQDMSGVPLFTHEPSINDIRQGELGDCYMLAALSAVLSKNPETIKNCMRDNGTTVTVRFYDTDKTPIYVEVDKKIPMKKTSTGESGQVKNRDAAGRQCLWVQMMERAYAASLLHLKWRGVRLPDGQAGADCTEQRDACASELGILTEELKALQDLYGEKPTDQQEKDIKKKQDQIDQKKKEYTYLFDADGTLTTTLQVKYEDIRGGNSADFLRCLLGTETQRRKMQDLQTRIVDFADKTITAKTLADTKERRDVNDLNEDEKRDILLRAITKSKLSSLSGEQFEKRGNLAYQIVEEAKRTFAEYVEEAKRTSAEYVEEAKRTFAEYVEEASPDMRKRYPKMISKALARTQQTLISTRENDLLDLVNLGWPAKEVVRKGQKKILDEFMQKTLDYVRVTLEKNKTSRLSLGSRTGEYFPMEEKLFQEIEEALTQGKYVTAGTKKKSGSGTGLNGEVRDDSGIYYGHAYTVVGTETRIINGKEFKFIKMRNPWGHKGADYYIKTESMQLKSKENTDNQGFFLVELSDLYNYYRQVRFTDREPVTGS